MFVCGVPKNIAEFSGVFNVSEDQFGELSISLNMAKRIFAFRPEIYSAIMTRNGTPAAYSSAYPLKEEWANAFAVGDIAEPDLTPDMLLSREDALNGASVYIGTVVVAGNFDPFTKSVLLASLFSWRARQMQDASVKRITAIMTPVTKHGQRLARYIGAERLGARTDVNGYAIYSRKLSPGFLYRITSSMEKLLSNSMVRLNLEFQPPMLPLPILSSPATAAWQGSEYV